MVVYRAPFCEETAMNPSPGHQKWPEHKIQESPVSQKVTVDIGGQRVAESSRTIRVDEDRHPSRYYFPRSDVKMEFLERSETTTQCPFKGTAHYFHVNLDGQRFDDAVWSYETPYDEHRELSGRLAFYDDKLSAIRIQVAA
jgi:uncharacterized protein (DUF427 family)